VLQNYRQDESPVTLEIFAKMLLWRFEEKILTFLGAKRLYKLLMSVCVSVCVCVCVSQFAQTSRSVLR